jgi:hypothetical protein
MVEPGSIVARGMPHQSAWLCISRLGISMLVQMILVPTFVLVGLTFLLLFWNGSGRSKPAEGDWFAYHLQMLFYVLVVLAIQTRHADLIMVMLAWVFVVLQVFQAGFLVSASARGSLFFLSGALILLAMWLYFAIRVLFLI